jgi:predicted  nucleic acid-binding Zn-ribbon protein
MPFTRILTLMTLLLLSAGAQETPPVENNPEPPPLTALDRKREALSRILLRKESIDKEIATIRKEISTGNLPKTEFEQTEASKKIASLQIEIDGLDTEFSKVSSGLDASELPNIGDENILIEEQVREIFKPIIQEFREITAAPRKAEELRTDINDLKRKLQILDDATSSLETTMSETNPAPLKKALDDEVGKLRKARLEIETELGIAQSKLDDLQRDSPTFLESFSKFIQDFFRSRGAHLLMAIGSTLGTLLLIRLLYRVIMKVGSKKRSREETFAGRVIHLCFMVASFLGGVIAFIFTLYLANDWLLLAFTLLFLFGLAWTGKNTIPQFFEQGKMILNLGPVRQNERIIFEGIPWQVQKVNIYTSLINPALEGGKIRLPMRDLISLHSRPNGEDELWFPCRKDDWVLLSDDTFGKVLQQTPDYVHIVKLGGTRKVIPTAEFLSLHPANLSKNFRLEVPFGIDYSHQAIAISKVPKILEVTVQRALIEKIDKELFLSVKVFFTSAAASSLDYRIVVDLDGDLAPRRDALKDLISATCVEACNQHGWVIPFTQITVHQAEIPTSESESTPAPRLP